MEKHTPESKDYFARAVACMNALTGLNPEGVKDVVEALEAILRRAADPALCDDTDKLLRDARAALAKIKTATKKDQR